MSFTSQKVEESTKLCSEAAVTGRSVFSVFSVVDLHSCSFWVTADLLLTKEAQL